METKAKTNASHNILHNRSEYVTILEGLNKTTLQLYNMFETKSYEYFVLLKFYRIDVGYASEYVRAVARNQSHNQISLSVTRLYLAINEHISQKL